MNVTHRHTVQTVFNKIVPYYDAMNDCLSLGLHRLWKSQCIDSITVPNPLKILDMSTGTGDMLLRLVKKYPKASFVAIDPDPQMLRYAQLKVAKSNVTSKIEYYCLCAEELASLSTKFDLIVCSFGFRNMTDKETSLKHMYDSLEKSGQIRILEFSPDLMEKSHIYKWYCQYYMPSVGKVLFNDSESYQYLFESIASFYTSQQMKELFCKVGFENPFAHSYTQGIAYLYGATML